MAESKRVYRVEFDPVSGGWVSGNNVVSCLCCMSIIHTHGGGVEYLCDSCHELMRRRKIFQVLKLARKYGEDAAKNMAKSERILLSLRYGKEAETNLAEIVRVLKEQARG